MRTVFAAEVIAVFLRSEWPGTTPAPGVAGRTGGPGWHVAGDRKVAWDRREGQRGAVSVTAEPDPVSCAGMPNSRRYSGSGLPLKAMRLISRSPTLAKLFAEDYNKEVGMVMNVPVLQEQSESPVTRLPSPVPYLLYQGALNEGRGLEHLIEAMQYIDAKLLLAGEGDLSSELRALVKQLNLENKVEFLGYVKPADLRAITAQAYIGINLLENKGLSYYYSLSNKFFDYIHARVPQVCIGFPEYQALNDKYNVAVLTQNCSIEEIKEAILRLLNDKELYCTLQKKCEVCRQELNWQEEEKKLWALYEQLFR